MLKSFKLYLLIGTTYSLKFLIGFGWDDINLEEGEGIILEDRQIYLRSVATVAYHFPIVFY